MGWVLEIAKMFLYISFPVGIFHYVNQPAYFEEYVIKAKQEYYPPESRRANEQMENFIRDFNITMEEKRLEAMEMQNRNKH
ncbi:protein PET100 homolog, mitochondrial [Solenopsis invicta]|uniref:protein PET100 homolog, mitochondrial n=1 Tax=Solenopsis invicta TaxID=13686 RepID=UPI000E33FD27|nr:protein PET100 homolog, mitochondrial [Solenopsis invicta]XP_025993423.1 protein PET100 homolog, mitochondrial [Solenopsis invicta]XP_025993424.1 protein PET100 homolog, mitochondrial [Solenopsis invicta]XP_025993425.1 protein PET100 homolog, mitochondrial [Solenopsis invicta]